MFKKPMKMRDLEFLGVPSYMVDIWEKNYSPYLLAVQEEAVRRYGVLDYGNGDDPGKRRLQGTGNNHLLVLSPTSSGKTFIGEMAAITQAIQKKKAIYLVPLRSLAEEKYRHFKKLYSEKNCHIDILVSSRDRREDDKKIVKGEYQIAIMVYEKFNYFLLKYPRLLKDISLIIIDELQMIHDPIRGPLLEGIIEYTCKNNPEIRLISLSAYLENEAGFLNWLPAHHLLSFVRPVELRKGILREGTFRYITHNKGEYGEEEFFEVKEDQNTPYENCLKSTISHFIKNNEPTLLFFPTKKETRKWAAWLAEVIDAPGAEEAIAELSRLDETRSRDELLYLLEKGIAYHNADLSWEERNLVESYLKKGEIKIICATTTLAMGINLPFKNVILSVDKYVSGNGDYKSSYRTSLDLADVENMGGRAGRLNWKKEEFGRVIFLADSLFAETVLQNIFFKFMKEDIKRHREMISEDGELYIPALKSSSRQLYRPVKIEKDFITFLLRAMVNGEDSKDKLKNYLRRVTPDSSENSSYWSFDFAKEDLEKEIDLALDELLAHHLITEELSPTEEGILICAKGIGIKTYLYFKEYLENKKGKLSNLEIITLLALCEEGKRFFLPFPQFNHRVDRYNWDNWKGEYYSKMRQLVLEAGEEYKELYQDIFNKENSSLDTEDFLSIKKAVLLYDWMGEKEIRKLEEEYKIYGGPIQKLGEEFSWLADALGGVAEGLGWDGKKEGFGSKGSGLTEEDDTKKENLGKIKVLSERLAWGIEEEGLRLARLYIPGLSRSYIRVLLREGYDDEKCLQELSVEGLAKVVPKRLAERIKKRFSVPAVLPITETGNPKLENCNPKSESGSFLPKPVTILEIDIHRPDRIIFECKEVKVTAIAFSLLHLLAQHTGKVVGYEEILNELWKDEEDAIYHRLSYHLAKIKNNILKTRKHNDRDYINSIFMVIKGRGLMLNLRERELKITF